MKKREKTELLTANSLFEKILNGGYPEIYVTKDIDREKFFESYIRTYIERDVRQLINVQDEITLRILEENRKGTIKLYG